MGAVSWAANDPIFWLHHCNIDRIWASWNRAGGRNPSDEAYLGQVFTLVDETGKPLPIGVADVLDTAALGYGYDRYLDRPSGSAPFFPGLSGLRFTQHAASYELSGTVTLGGGPTTVRLTADRGNGHYFRRLRSASAAGRPFYLRVAGVRITRQPGVSYEVHLDPAPLAACPTAQAAPTSAPSMSLVPSSAAPTPGRDRRPIPTRGTTALRSPIWCEICCRPGGCASRRPWCWYQPAGCGRVPLRPLTTSRWPRRDRTYSDHLGPGPRSSISRKFCTAAPEAPLPRLSRRATSTAWRRGLFSQT